MFDLQLVVIWLAFAGLVASLAARRGRSAGGWFVGSVIFSPLLAGIALFLSANRSGPRADTHVRCPDCRELVARDARVCSHCRCRLIPQ